MRELQKRTGRYRGGSQTVHFSDNRERYAADSYYEWKTAVFRKVTVGEMSANGKQNKKRLQLELSVTINNTG